jgi:hypothetical protein
VTLAKPYGIKYVVRIITEITEVRLDMIDGFQSQIIQIQAHFLARWLTEFIIENLINFFIIRFVVQLALVSTTLTPG